MSNTINGQCVRVDGGHYRYGRISVDKFITRSSKIIGLFVGTACLFAGGIWYLRTTPEQNLELYRLEIKKIEALNQAKLIDKMAVGQVPLQVSSPMQISSVFQTSAPQQPSVPCNLYDATRLKLHEPKNLPFDGFPDCDSWSKAKAVELKYGADEVRHEADDPIKYAQRKGQTS